MEFVTRIFRNKYESILLTNSREVIFRLRVPDNKIENWAKALQKWLDVAPQKLSLLVTHQDEVPICTLRPSGLDNEQTNLVNIIFLKVMCGVLKVLDFSAPHYCDTTLLYKIVQEYIISNRHFNVESSFQSLIADRKYVYGFWVENQSFRRFFHSADGEDDEVNMVSQEWWRLLLTPENMPPTILMEILLNDDLTEQIVYHKTVSSLMRGLQGGFLLSSYGCFVKALIDFLDETHEAQFIPFKNKIPILCAMVVKNEYIGLDDQKRYIERIFNNRSLSQDSKNDLLINDVFVNLCDDAKRNPDLIVRMIPAANAISQYYFKQYDIDRALQPWFSIADQGNLFLRIILAFYKKPHAFAMISVMAMVLTLLPHFYSDKLPFELAALSANILFLTGSLVCTVIGVSLIFQFFTKQDINYIELLMPRLLGAIAVGLSLLVLENTVWETSLRLNWGNWGFLITTTLMGALIYIFVEVHKNTRLLPISKDTNQLAILRNSRLNWFRKKRTAHRLLRDDAQANTEKRNNPVIRSMQNTAKIFWIGFFDALALSMLVSMLFGSAIFPDHFLDNTILDRQVSTLGILLPIQILGNDEFGFLGYGWALGRSFIRFVYFPKITLLWSGLSLFIGTFVQLLWQDQKITSS